MIKKYIGALFCNQSGKEMCVLCANDRFTEPCLDSERLTMQGWEGDNLKRNEFTPEMKVVPI